MEYKFGIFSTTDTTQAETWVNDRFAEGYVLDVVQTAGTYYMLYIVRKGKISK